MSFVASDSVKETDFEGSYWKLTAFPYHCRNLLFFFPRNFYGDSKVFGVSHHSSK